MLKTGRGGQDGPMGRRVLFTNTQLLDQLDGALEDILLETFSHSITTMLLT